ncbi:uncharacterized protein LOC125945658 [Dermacentor silvarum]|uniref:uncharacterized protein LOC125945658 n=1 Tax=Dermacentor silvarum TaxID=543639 RepID=UPI0021016139|nr:uncharacterized protein LOC125945658 [Dermacentor silvarum]
MAFGNFASALDGEVEWVAGVKVLGVVFHTSGEVAQETWTDLRKKAEVKVSVASKFSLTLAERSYIVKSSVCAAFYYVARIARPPRRASQRLATLCGSFLWDNKTELVARPLLRLPTELGGFSLPCIRTMSSVLALRGFYDLVNDPEYPGRKLVEYFLGTSRKLFLPGKRTGPTAEQPPPFYKYVCSTLQSLRTALPDVELVSTPATEVCEWLAVKHLSQEELQRCRSVRWRSLTSSAVPAEVRDFGWRRGWRVLPTRNRTAAWGISRTDRCPQCRQEETLQHALFECANIATLPLVPKPGYDPHRNSRFRVRGMA